MKSFIWISQKYDKDGDILTTRHLMGESLINAVETWVKKNVYDDPYEIESLFNLNEEVAEEMSGEAILKHVKELTSEYPKGREFAVTIWDITDSKSPKTILQPEY
jgi:hypothetical protein